MSRKRTPDRTEAAVLIASRRRCALCYGLVGDLDQKRGQIAHVDRDPSNAHFDNLAFLCLHHHDEYDSKTSQSKRFTPSELITYRRKLYDRVSQGLDDRASPSEAVQRASSAATAPLGVHQLRFALLQDRQVRTLRGGGEAFEVDFRLLNTSSPPHEIKNVFGNIWVDSAAYITSTLPPTLWQSGAPRVEWDIQIPVFPKQGAFIPTRMALRMPSPGREVLVGAQFVSKETDREEYLWKIVNDEGKPKTVVIKSPRVSQ